MISWSAVVFAIDCPASVYFKASLSLMACQRVEKKSLPGFHGFAACVRTSPFSLLVGIGGSREPTFAGLAARAGVAPPRSAATQGA